MVEAALKSPCIPLFSNGKFRSRTLTPRWKRGEGETFGWSEGQLYRELLGQDTRFVHRTLRLIQVNPSPITGDLKITGLLLQAVQRFGVVREDFFFDGGANAFHPLKFIQRCHRTRWIGVTVVGADH
jgi:hypothetical protein